MGRLNGSLLHRLERIELLVPAVPEPVDDDDDVVLPAPVVAVLEYLEGMDQSRWYDHALIERVCSDAVRDGPRACLLAAQAWILRTAWVTLADWWGQDAAGWHDADQTKRRAAGRDSEPAAQQLLGMDARTLNAWWVGPHELWVDRWRAAGTDDPIVRSRAGLGEREIELLGVDSQ